MDLIYPPNKLCLFSCRMSEKTKFISVERKAIICGFKGKKEMAFVEEKNCFCSRHKFGPYLEKMKNTGQSTACIINKKICFLQSYENKFNILFDNEARKLV